MMDAKQLSSAKVTTMTLPTPEKATTSGSTTLFTVGLKTFLKNNARNRLLAFFDFVQRYGTEACNIDQKYRMHAVASAKTGTGLSARIGLRTSLKMLLTLLNAVYEWNTLESDVEIVTSVVTLL